MALTNLTDFAGFLRRDFDPADAYTAQQLLEAAESLVVEYCGWHIAPVVTEDVTVDGSGTAILPLPTMHLTAVNTVTENGLPVDVTRVYWSSHGLLERAGGVAWTGRPRGVVANVAHGYPQAPQWLAHLVYSAAGRALNAAVGVTQEGAGGEQVGYTPAYLVPPGAVALHPLEQKMLDRIAVPGRP